MSGCHGFGETTGLKDSDIIWSTADNFLNEESYIQYQISKYVKYKELISPNDKIEYVNNTNWEIKTKKSK